ncbi:MAG: hypothetical protein U9532_02330 ['Conium maculatum' witches'-broom phytoplasma]|nr:hypothetical protein ['Conium maculatum' witches'-broom phytoplasma]
MIEKFLEIKGDDPIADLNTLFGEGILTNTNLSINFENMELPDKMYEKGTFYDEILEENIEYNGVDRTTKKWEGNIESLDIFVKEVIAKIEQPALKNSIYNVILKTLEAELYNNMLYIPVTHIKELEEN